MKLLPSIPRYLTIASMMLTLGQTETASAVNTRLNPDGVVGLDEVVTASLSGLPPNQSVLLQIGHWTDRGWASLGEPWRESTGPAAGPIKTSFRLSDLRFQPVHRIWNEVRQDAASHSLPAVMTLALRTCLEPSDGECTNPIFHQLGLGAKTCSGWNQFFALLGFGCGERGFRPIRFGHLGPLPETGGLFEVHRMNPAQNGDYPSSALPGTRGATGFAWLNANTLLVTIGNVRPRAPSATVPLPGLYRIPLSGLPELLYGHDESHLSAPFALSPDRFAFVEAGARESSRGSAQKRFLVISSSMKEEQRWPLPLQIHRFFHYENGWLLGLELDATGPRFVRVSTETGSLEVMGFTSAAYAALLREPGGTRSAVAYEDLAEEFGWELALVDEQGSVVKDLRVRRELDDLHPCWSPSTGELLFLSEVRP